MKIVLLGKPGSGKGTQAEKLSVYLNVPWVSTGQMLRDAYARKTKFGLNAAEKYWLNGQLVPDEIMIRIVKEKLREKDCKKGFILDGFPRTIRQAEGLEDVAKIDYVIDISCSDKLIVKRLTARRQCKKCNAVYGLDFPAKKQGICDKCGGGLYQRDDDEKETVKKRLGIYNKQTAPLIEFYRKRKLLIEIDGSKSVDLVFGDIKRKLIKKKKA